MTPDLDRPDATAEFSASVTRAAIVHLARETGAADVHGEEIGALLQRSREAEGHVASIAEADALAVTLRGRTGR